MALATKPTTQVLQDTHVTKKTIKLIAVTEKIYRRQVSTTLAIESSFSVIKNEWRKLRARNGAH